MLGGRANMRAGYGMACNGLVQDGLGWDSMGSAAWRDRCRCGGLAGAGRRREISIYMCSQRTCTLAVLVGNHHDGRGWAGRWWWWW